MPIPVDATNSTQNETPTGLYFAEISQTMPFPSTLCLNKTTRPFLSAAYEEHNRAFHVYDRIFYLNHVGIICSMSWFLRRHLRSHEISKTNWHIRINKKTLMLPSNVARERLSRKVTKSF
jgi:hypothetical protein